MMPDQGRVGMLALAIAMTAGYGGQAAARSGPDAGTAPSKREATLAIGARAPGGTLTACDGTRVELASLWRVTPAVVVFYRGHW